MKIPRERVSVCPVSIGKGLVTVGVDWVGFHPLFWFHKIYSLLNLAIFGMVKAIF
mgnify:CR=1 FL=1